ncbi:DeoR/GlpR family DNA-binding transcription regulator [Vibrio penaeicida]|uniref:DeoR/GlpR family transcriptional regulator n=1 Tax=Vibrio penaeicida TaxID=104609 RepID=A0AAV5P169_9VIBR|nr:DeoR/GlpR family DNA-binding transcription regulator [Vibrio penaeicida]MDP2571828.1 DeoR/GlpR family DNA-binding transcription regulator [Vibrio penaeicida]RTZ21580.1 DeoR/GlpR transcriptional regulator [Vibrio penaeicida]GLQ76480.1 DeoR/GlpR family transcriptional regulator [Vibrio penaeicida]
MNHDPKITKKTDIRRELIIEMTQQEGNVSVETLVEVLGVSAQTIRRDINHLCNDNRLRRRHGGVERFEQPLNTPYDQRAITNHSEKRAIAMAAADMIPNGSTLFISIGSTPAMVAEALHDKTGLTVMTNNLNAAMALSSELTNRVILPGGELRLPDRDILGDDVLTFFNSYRAEFGIFGVAGVSEDGGMLDFHASEVRVREAIRTHCKTSILVMDSTKLSRIAPAVGGSIFDVDQIIMNQHPNEDVSAISERVGDRLKLVGGMS